jgi:hypothetical protein
MSIDSANDRHYGYFVTMNAAPAPALRILASLILEDVRCDAGVRWFGDRKVFLSTVPGIDLTDADCRADLDVMRRAGLLEFARADLVAAMDPAIVAASEWRLDGATMHFLVVPALAPGTPATRRCVRPRSDAAGERRA